MSRRKQLHPKSMKEDEQILFALPRELKYETNKIITRIDLEQDHCFGRFPAILKIEDRIESFHLIHIQHNWLTYCSSQITQQSFENLNLIFQNNQLIVMTKQPIPSGTRLYSNKIILPNQIKQEPMEIEILPQGCVCDGCGIRFTNQNTLTAHREHYCIKPSHSTKSMITTGIKRKSSDNSSLIPTKRLLNEKSCSKSIPFTRPIQIGQFIYVPIPIVSSQPLNLTKSKRTNQCEYCSISFQSFENLQAHQDNYCLQYKKQTNSSRFNEFLFKCTICSAMFNNEQILLDHIQCVHTNTTLIECLKCQSRFCSKWNLIRHMKLLHTNIKSDELLDSNNLIPQKYSCPSCHIRFTQFDTLIEHMKNYCQTYCSSCEISFQHKASYEAHKMYYCRKMDANISD